MNRAKKNWCAAWFCVFTANTSCGPEQVCEPRSRGACTCENMQTGARVCDADGTRYGVCMCGERCSNGVGDLRACSCGDGATGLQFCPSPDAVWSACDCAPRDR